MEFEGNIGGADGVKDRIHAKKWYVYNSEKQYLVNDGYFDEGNDKERKKVIWEAVNDHVVEEGVKHEELGLQGFDFVLFNEEREVHTSIDNNY